MSQELTVGVPGHMFDTYPVVKLIGTDVTVEFKDAAQAQAYWRAIVDSMAAYYVASGQAVNGQVVTG
jgi:hypothetical protein